MLKKVDNLGRVVIPIGIREELGITDTANIEIRRDECILKNPNKDSLREYIERAKDDLTNMLNNDEDLTDDTKIWFRAKIEAYNDILNKNVKEMKT